MDPLAIITSLSFVASLAGVALFLMGRREVTLELNFDNGDPVVGVEICGQFPGVIPTDQYGRARIKRNLRGTTITVRDAKKRIIKRVDLPKRLPPVYSVTL